MPKIAFIGAGSMVFARKLITDILSFPELSDSTITLMDIDERKLARTTSAAKTLVETNGLETTIESTTERRDALVGADYVLTMINVGGTEPFENEIHIPKKYGVKQAIGDTLGPGGVFRALRTTETMLDIAADIEEYCPNALLLNYTNPMAILCWVLEEATDVETVGLCHSVPHTAEAIATYVDVPADSLDYWVAGVNHVAWFLRCEHDGQDVYPALEDAMADPEIYERDTVRFEMLKHFGAFCTESSHHLSEYVPYFRTEQETIDEMTGTGYAKRMETASYLNGWKRRSTERETLERDATSSELEIQRSEEYASRLIHAIETDTPRQLNLNVPNADGTITNFPQDACVEVPCLVDGTGVHPCTVSALSPQLAAICQSQIAVQECAVVAALTKDREAVYHALKLDPLTSAVLSLEDIHEMTDALLEANAAYLPEFS